MGTNQINPELVFLRLTNRCNAKCIMCSTWKMKYEEPDEYTLKRIVVELKNSNVDEIRLTGGEPSLYKEFNSICEYILSKKMKLSVISNGNIFRSMSRNLLLDFNKVIVSIDSANPEKHDKVRGKEGIWKQAVDGITKLKKEVKAPKIHTGQSNDHVFPIPCPNRREEYLLITVRVGRPGEHQKELPEGDL